MSVGTGDAIREYFLYFAGIYIPKCLSPDGCPRFKLQVHAPYVFTHLWGKTEVHSSLLFTTFLR